MPIKIHLDTDMAGDIDDLCALALLLRWPEPVEFTGITTVAELNGQRAGYTRFVLALENRATIPVAAGADNALGFYPYELGLPHAEDYWPEPVPPAPGPLDAALDLLKASIDQDAVILAIGPYTNLYLLDQKYSGILQQARMVLMGGYVFPVRPGFPQWGNDMDFNVQIDVRSAMHVFEQARNLTLIPLSVTVETALRRAYLPGLRQSGPLGALIARQAESFAEEYRNEQQFGATCPGLPADIINFQHDPLACAVALGWRDGVTIEELPLSVTVEDNLLFERVDPVGRPVKVVTRVDGPRFSEFWKAVLTAPTSEST